MESSFNTFVYGNSYLPQSVTSLPAYTRRPSPQLRARREMTEHVAELSSDITNKRAKPWATLRVYSKAPAGTLPIFVEGEKITGSVTLDSGMSHSRHISCVKIIVRGELSTGVLEVDRVTFLEASTTLWSKDAHATRQEDGMHWPFSIHLPREVSASSGTMNYVQAYALPPTFMERNTRACIRYNLIVHISRSKFREDNNLQMAWIYIPASRPDPPSQLRQLAYQENSPLLGPEADLKGWYTLPSAKVHGTLFKNRVIEVTLKLSLAQPLSYTRGSVIPLSLTLSSTDSQALDLLSSDRALAVRLRRKVTSNRAQNLAEFNAPWNATQGAVSTEPIIDIAGAVWWQRPGSTSSNETGINSTMLSKVILYKELEGEILLSKSLKPTFHISHFGIEYYIVVLPFDTTGFVPSTSAQKIHNGPIIEQRVEIMTMFPKGPRPISHSPPEYQGQSTNTGSLPPSRASPRGR
ncbi:hypothetical protein F5890DRAFT_1405227 [Lentinula detonsa]|uniref:Arrestin-like N-terminal domain-containing protein n=1 Tax=Lentinula detonsa TaxID=2804962 RepID=A0AA38UUK1_9AGAR|nr:hypothetical protein F5890DRAFT_1405227 [Lentinula detonsa]